MRQVAIFAKRSIIDVSQCFEYVSGFKYAMVLNMLLVLNMPQVLNIPCPKYKKVLFAKYKKVPSPEVYKSYVFRNIRISSGFPFPENQGFF